MALTIRGTQDFLANGVASPLFHGQIPGLSYLGLTRRKSPTQGQQWVLRFESAASLNPLLASPCEVGYALITGFFAAEVESSGPKHTLRVFCPDDPTGAVGDAVTTFELAGNEQQKDLREHPKALLLGPNVLDEINQVIKREKAYNQASFPSNPEALALYDRIRQRDGNAYFAKAQYVLKVNRVVSNLSLIDVGYRNVDKIMSTAQMITETGPPTGILRSIADAETQARADYIPYNTGIWLERFVLGWLKKTPTVTTTANFKVQTTSEYWFENWDTWTYQQAT